MRETYCADPANGRDTPKLRRLASDALGAWDKSFCSSGYTIDPYYRPDSATASWPRQVVWDRLEIRSFEELLRVQFVLPTPTSLAGSQPAG